MILKEIISQFSFSQVFSEICSIIPAFSSEKVAIEEAYNFLLSQQPVSSKKRITYQLIDAQDSDDCFVGAEDRCFEAQWNVIIGKEVIIEDDLEISPLEIAANSFFCILLLGFAPRRFSTLKEDLARLVE